MENWSDKRIGWLALLMTPGLGNIAGKNLLAQFGSPEAIFGAPLSELQKVEGVRKEVARNIIKRTFTKDPVRELKELKRCGGRIITFADPHYPAPLREIYDPPMVLYVRGQDIPPNMTFLAVVGSRNPTHYGINATEQISQGLARRGLAVVSGMARGIDSVAHWGCLSGKGFTVAVLGTGIDRIYPASNRKLASQIMKNGTILSEFPLGTPPEPRNFPIRNRIISGLSRGVVVIEATKKSGSLITASTALEQGREVFAVPGSINSFKSTGCHFLIKQGARLIENSDDVLDELGLNYPYATKTDTFIQDKPVSMDASEKAIYDLIGDYPIHIDKIARERNLEPGELSSILMRMELKGIIKQLPGKTFVR